MNALNESTIRIGHTYETRHGSVRVHELGKGDLGSCVTYSKVGQGTETKFTVLESYFVSIINA